MAPRETEEGLNRLLGASLISRHPLWNTTNVHVEQTRLLREHSGKRIDVLVVPPPPVAIEAKTENPGDVEKQAISRLGMVERERGRVIESAFAVIYIPKSCAGRMQLYLWIWQRSGMPCISNWICMLPVFRKRVGWRAV